MPLLPVQISDLKNANRRVLARALTLVENDLAGSKALLLGLKFEQHTPVIGITGPPGAGKSTLVNAIIQHLIYRDKKVAVLAIDPTSPFNYGSLLGDRIRMNAWFNHPNVFIRSLATRGSLGGLSAKTIEMTDVLKSAGFDFILIETVGIGQSEVEVAGLADKTLVVLVPESGDEIQHIKSGMMEIADAFIVNKADREGADVFAAKLEKMLLGQVKKVPVYKTVAETNLGVDCVADFIRQKTGTDPERRLFLYAEKAFALIREKRMADVTKEMLRQKLSEALLKDDFNLYKFTEGF